MLFKDKYIKENEKIMLDDNFIDMLAEKMAKEASGSEKTTSKVEISNMNIMDTQDDVVSGSAPLKRRSIKRFIPIATSVAAILLIVSAIINNVGKNELKANSGNDTAPTVVTTVTAKNASLSVGDSKELESLNETDERSFGKYVWKEKLLTGEISENSPRLTLASARDIIACNTSFAKIIKKFEEAQKYPDFIGGSGVTLIEYWFDEIGSEKILIITEQEEIYYQVYERDNTLLNLLSSEKLFSKSSSAKVENNVSDGTGNSVTETNPNISKVTTNTAITTCEPQVTSALIQTENTTAYTSSVSVNTQATISTTFTAKEETTKLNEDERNRQLEELRKEGKRLFGEFVWKEKVLLGVIPQDASRLTLETAKAIIADSTSFADIMKKFEGAQEYPDFKGGSGITLLEYWLDETGDKKLVINYESSYIYYAEILSGKSERLF